MPALPGASRITMKLPKTIIIGSLLAVLLSLVLPSFGIANQNRVPAGPTVVELRRQFQNPPDDSRIMMRWWWFGPTISKSEIEREMRLMKEGGIGGFEVQPV